MAMERYSAGVGSARTVYQPVDSARMYNAGSGNVLIAPVNPSEYNLRPDVKAQLMPSPAVQQIAAAQGVAPAAADVRSVPTSLGAAFTVPSGSRGDAAMSELQSILGTLSANSARATAESQAFAREQMAFQEAQNAKAMEFNAEQARINREWQEIMSNTAHQREVADLRAAGLNPVLSAMGGNGAVTTSGATAQGVSSAGAKGEVYDVNAALSGVLSTMLSGMMNLEAANINARTQEAVADKYTASNQLIEGMREAFEAKYPANFWRMLSGAMNDVPNAVNGTEAQSALGIAVEAIGDILYSAIHGSK